MQQIKNSAAWARERTIPTEKPPLVGEVTAKLMIDSVTWLAWWFPKAVFTSFYTGATTFPTKYIIIYILIYTTSVDILHALSPGDLNIRGLSA
jgi:hypothetical protein